MIKNDKDPNGEAEGYALSFDDLHEDASTVILAKNLADYLERHYSGWMWAINIDSKGGVTNLFSMRLSGRWGYTFKTMTLQNDPSNRALMRGAGELLERFGHRAGPYNHDRWSTGATLMGLPRADVSDKGRREQRDFRTDSIKQGLRDGTAKIITDSDIAAARRAVG